jgi:excisionase family DNA binding protein
MDENTSNEGISKELELLTAEEAAVLLKVAPSTVYRMMRSVEIPCVKFGRCVRIRPGDLQRFIAEHVSC